MRKTELEQKVLDALEQVAQEHAIDIVDVEVVGAKSAPCIRVRIDHADESLPTITLDQVTEQSGWINEQIDALDPVESAYSLEISSPGMDRPLRRLHDFERFVGETVAMTLDKSEGRRRYTGEISGVEDGKISITNEEGTFTFTLDEIKSAKIKPTF